MARYAELGWWVDSRSTLLDDLLRDWSSAATSDDRETLEPLERHLKDLVLDDVEITKSDDDHPLIYAQRLRAGSDAPTVLVVGTTDVDDLVGFDPQRDAPRVDDEGVIGPGVASRFGSFLAHIEGFVGLSRDHDGQPPTNLKILGLSSGAIATSTLSSALDTIDTDDVDVIIASQAVAWDLEAPTITLGSRGHLVAEITISSGNDLDLATFAGATRNPLFSLLDVLQDLRNDSGRIMLPGFYHRAKPPTDEERTVLSRGDFNASAWLRGTGAVELTGGPPALERTSLWPTLDIIDVRAGAGARVGEMTIPGSATATVAIQLVVDQDPIEVEASLRNWLTTHCHEDLTASVTRVSMASPFRVARDTAWVVGQARALKRVLGSAPLPVVSGGSPGVGALSDLIGAPLLFSGLASPANRISTGSERLTHQRLRTGINLSAEMFDQFRKRGRGTRTSQIAQGA